MKNRSMRDLAAMSALLAAGIMIQGVEAMYLPPVLMFIPGAKLGLASSVTLVMIILFDPKDALAHVFLRTSTVSLITGTFLSTTYLYSLCGGVVSALLMFTVYNRFYGRFSFVGVSIFGALSHNLTQLALSIYILGHIGVVSFLPWLLTIGLMTGTANGTIVNIVEARLRTIRSLPSPL